MNLEPRTSNLEPYLAERGSVLLYAMLTMSVMLAISLSLSALFINKLRSAESARDSVGAFYVADSAVEKCLFEARQNANQPPLVFSFDAQYSVQSLAVGTPDVTDACASLGSSSFQFRATGTYHGVRRTLEISQ